MTSLPFLSQNFPRASFSSILELHFHPSQRDQLASFSSIARHQLLPSSTISIDFTDFQRFHQLLPSSTISNDFNRWFQLHPYEDFNCFNGVILFTFLRGDRSISASSIWGFHANRTWKRRIRSACFVCLECWFHSCILRFIFWA